MPRFVTRQTLPGKTAPLAPAIQPLERQLAYGLAKLREGTTIVADAKVVKVTAHLARQCLPEVGSLQLSRALRSHSLTALRARRKRFFEVLRFRRTFPVRLRPQ